jgi:hypothetical protein
MLKPYIYILTYKQFTRHPIRASLTVYISKKNNLQGIEVYNRKNVVAAG